MTTKATKLLYELICSLGDENVLEGDSQAIRDRNNFMQGWNTDVRSSIQKLFAASGLAKSADYSEFVIDKTATFTITLTQTQPFHLGTNVNTAGYQWEPEVIEYNKDRIDINFATLAGLRGDFKAQALLEHYGIRCEPSKAALLACAFNKKAWMQYLIKNTTLDVNEIYTLSHDYQAGLTYGQPLRLTETCRLNLLSLAVVNLHLDLAKLLVANRADLRATLAILGARFFRVDNEELSNHIRNLWEHFEKAMTQEVVTPQSASVASLIVMRHDGPLHRTPVQSTPQDVVESNRSLKCVMK